MPMEMSKVKIIVDGKNFEVKPGRNLLDTCLSLGIDIPHFCFHPALGSVGACRLCAVKKFKDKNDEKGKIIMSCMEPVTDGLIVSVDDPEARAFRASVIESLMTNHPHDCPVCDEGGECHLQDMTIMTGHNYRRFDFPKRTYNNQELGPFISHEMNRCIQCYRCVRFYRDYAGGKDLNAFASRNHVYFGRQKDGTLENVFSGNLVEVCPTGVFTDKTLQKHFTRKWDLSNSPSVCVHCSVGCNTIASERYDSLRRIMSRYNGAVNGYFLCDRGRFGYEFVNDSKRIKNAEFPGRNESSGIGAESDQLLSALEIPFSKNKKLIGIGSPRASVESNFALLSLVGENNFYHGVPEKEFQLTRTISDFLQHSSIHTASLKQVERADAVLVLGEDLTNTAPMIALALRQISRNLSSEAAAKKGIQSWNDYPVRELAQDFRAPVFILTTFNDPLDEIADQIFRGSCNILAGLGSAIARELDKNAPEPETDKADIRELAGEIAQSLKNAKHPLIISGISCGDENIIHAALNIASALLSAGSDAMISMVLPECNSMGLSLFPGKPFGYIPGVADTDTLIVLENDLFRRGNKSTVHDFFCRYRQKVVLDHLTNKTTVEADIVLPAATFAGSEGTFVNNEGRAQRFYKALNNNDQVKESWKWIGDLIKIRNKMKEVPWKNLDDITRSLASDMPLFSRLLKYMPDADFRMINAKIPRQTIRYSGRTAMSANVSVSEPRLIQDPDSPLAFSMEGQEENPPSSLVPFYWMPGWNSVQAMYNYLDEPDGSLKGGDPGIRLIEPVKGIKNIYFKTVSEASRPEDGEWLIVPVYQIFGSEELSSLSPSIAQRISEPFVVLSRFDADKIDVKEGDYIELETITERLKVRVITESYSYRGLAGLSAGMPEMPFVDIPCTGRFHKL
jgi:NADH-quinone oxidoreductase subunit G